MRWVRRSAAGRATGLVALAALAAAAADCVPPAPPAGPTAEAEGQGPPRPPDQGPEVRVGLAVGAPAVTLGGAVALILTAADGSRLGTVPAGETWRVTAGPAELSVADAVGTPMTSARVFGVSASDGQTPLRVDGRAYRGSLDLFRDRTGVTVVNRVALEAYVAGVVSAEMGRRSPGEVEALRAQAVVSRTYARRGAGRRRADGFDLYATVADQVYGGVAAETPEGTEAVGSTRGLILTYGNAPIDAFYYSTCGGRTAEGGEVFRGAIRPYLRSTSDLDPNGVAYCSTSPRYRWREEWDGEALRSTLRRTLPAVVGVAAGQVREVRDVRVLGRTRSGRVAGVGISLSSADVAVDGPRVRQVLRTASGEPLRSNAFTLAVRAAGGRVAHLEADGAGAGHGVGMCQWGAVGRARAGQTYQQILAAYFQGAALERLY